MNLKIPQATKKGYIEVCPYGAFDWAYPNSKLRRGRVQGGVISAPLSFAKTKSMSMSQYPLNPEPDGTSRTIKANYWKVSRANFIRGGGTEQRQLSVLTIGQIWKSILKRKKYNKNKLKEIKRN